jgi:hypothetical protein
MGFLGIVSEERVQQATGHMPNPIASCTGE